MGKYVSIIFSTKKIQKKIKKSITGEFVPMGVVRLSLKTVINSVDGQFALTLWHSSSPSAKENILFPSNKMSLSEIMETKASPEKNNLLNKIRVNMRLNQTTRHLLRAKRPNRTIYCSLVLR